MGSDPMVKKHFSATLSERHQRPLATKQPYHQRIQAPPVCGNDVEENATIG